MVTVNVSPQRDVTSVGSVYKTHDNYITVRTTWTEMVSADETSDCLIHCISKSVFVLSPKSLTSEVPSSRLMRIGCTVAHYGES